MNDKTTNIKSDSCQFYTLHFAKHESGCAQVNLTDRPPQFGVFFDGTGNNLANDIARWDDDKAPTNVAKLYLLYKAQRVMFAGATYVSGVGTSEGATDSDSDMGFAYSFGDRVRRALNETRTFFISGKFKNAPIGILDVFGFSRGAAAARHFVNEVHRLNNTDPEFFGGPQLQIRFLGIFDTVGSIGIAGDNSQRDVKGEEFNLDLHPQAAQHVYHLTARHEQREYFPLSSIYSGPGQKPGNHFEEVDIHGAHADVGGGYGPGPDIVYYPMQSVGWSTRIIREEKLNELKKRYHQQYFAPGIDIDLNVLKDIPAGAGMYTQVAPIWRRNVKPQLAHVALHMMHKKAIENGVPLEGLESLIEKPEFRGRSPQELFEIPGDLNSKIRMGAGGDDYIYRHYIHHSHQFRRKPQPGKWFDIVNSNKPEDNPSRQSTNGKREIFYNDADKGISPGTRWRRVRVGSGEQNARWERE